jgi:hypothetical protein
VPESSFPLLHQDPFFDERLIDDFGILDWPGSAVCFGPPRQRTGSGEARSGGNSSDWRAKVELFEEIRREYEFGVGTITGVSKKLGVHRRMVREAIGSAPPKPRKKTERPRWKMQAAVEFVDAVLETDRKTPRSSGTRRAGSGSGFGTSSRIAKSANERCGTTYTIERSRWGTA